MVGVDFMKEKNKNNWSIHIHVAMKQQSTDNIYYWVKYYF